MRLPLLLALALLLGAGAASAAERPWSEELERNLMSPYCPGRSLTECPSPQATELRLWIQAQERAGVPREQVEARLFQEFGDTLRHGPRAEGWGLVVLISRITPGLSYLIPLFILFRALGLTGTLYPLIIIHLVISVPIVVWVMLA